MIARSSHVRLHSGAEVGVVRFLTQPGAEVNGLIQMGAGAWVDFPRSGPLWVDLRDLVELSTLADLGGGPDGAA